MGGSAEDLGAPDLWEMADLEDSVRRLMTPSSSAAEEAVEDSSVDGRIPVVHLSQVDEFLREALEKPRERLSILRMEQDIEKFIGDPAKEQLEFQDLPTSYLRLAAHRVAQHYCLQSIAMPENILPDGSGSQIVLRKTSYCKLPSVRLADIPVNIRNEDNNSAIKVAIKQRSQEKPQAISTSSSHSSKSNHLKSVEERKEEYNRARARIFNSSGDSGAAVKTESETILQDSFPHHFSAISYEEPFIEEPKINLSRGLSDSFICGNRPNRNREEQEPVVSRYKPSNRVATLRDRELDRKDPDYNRSYDRYMQRFDPGFGFNEGHYNIQPKYSRAVNYNSEFPQLGSSHRPQILIEQQPHPIPHRVRLPWTATPPVGYGPPESMIAPFSLNHVGVHPASIYGQSSQYLAPSRPGAPYFHSHEHIQPFSQNHQQQPESKFGLARPR